MVNSVSSITQEFIDNDLYIQDALQRDYANYSAIARILKTKVEKLLGRKVKLESLITAVKRYSLDYQLLQEDITKIVAESVINLRTDVAKISVEKTKHTMDAIRRTLIDMPEEFFQIIEGVSAVTILFDQKLFQYVHKMIRKEEILDEKQSLATIIVSSPKEIIETPGCALAFYQAISRRRLNIEETLSCFTDTIIVLPMKEVSEAFTALTNLVSEARG
jgi:hypothetical protein